MAMKKAVVSTTIGAEGLKVSNGENIILADTPDDFTKEVLRCLNDPILTERIANEGKRLVDNQYRWEQLGEKLDRYLRKTAGVSR